MSDHLLLRVLVRLLRVRDGLGEEAFAHAAHRALLAIATSVHEGACQKARTARMAPKVIRFPLMRRRDGLVPPEEDG